jgi:hypothetical protein
MLSAQRSFLLCKFCRKLTQGLRTTLNQRRFSVFFDYHFQVILNHSEGCLSRGAVTRPQNEVIPMHSDAC